MDRWDEEGFEDGTERGRSPSGVPSSNPWGDFPREGDEPESGLAGAPVDPAAPPRGGSAAGCREEPEDLETLDDEADADFVIDVGEDVPEAGTSPPLPPVRDSVVRRRHSVKRTYRKPEWEPAPRTPQERLLLLDTWRRSGLPAGDFASLVGVSKHTLYAWKRRFDLHGPAGLLDSQRGGPRGSRLPELTKRTILMLKESHPEWGCQRLSDMLLRGPALPASPGAVARVLHEAGYRVEEEPTRPHPDKVRRFERARPNQLWQTDVFTFILKRQNRRVYLVAFLDDHSRFIVGYGLGGSPSAAWVIEVFRAAVASYQAPEEVLSDNGPQYVTWRGKSAFSRELDGRGIKHLVARPRRPQTLGKIERFWGSLWRECVEKAVFLDLLDAQKRVGLYIDHYNLQRPHQGIGDLVPADRYFHAAPEVLRVLKERAAANALDLARNGIPRAPFYLAGNAGGKPFSVHAEGERVILRRGAGDREEIELTGAAETAKPGPEEPDALPDPLCPSVSGPEGSIDDVPAPGTSPIDELGDFVIEARETEEEGGPDDAADCGD